MPMFINMLGINIESYGHVLGPPRVSSDFEKNNFSRKLRLFFNNLIGKIMDVIKVWSGIRSFHGGARFYTQSTHFTAGPTFLFLSDLFFT